ncbi:MAG: TonB-dependent receptor [Alphaproteobacteria bacterium]|nr:MAG: TonB-dependent receptor [Alphaproteobacteria bacterium]
MTRSNTLQHRLGASILRNVSVSAIVAPLAITPALAQTAAPTTTSGRLIEEVVVYSTKRGVGESAQGVPNAITAIGPGKIENTFSVDITEIGRLAPNVELQPVSTFPGFANFTIRGIGVNNSTRSIDPAVNVLMDGMVFGFQGATILETFDLESVEILRGPQGILFGRNTTGGAVSFRTRRPTGEFGVRGKVTVGKYDRFDASLSVEGPLVEDKVAAKIAILSRNQDGYFEDNNAGTFVPAPSNPSGLQPQNSTVDIPETEFIMVKPTIVFTPSQDLEITLLGQYLRSRGGSGAGGAFIPEDGTLTLAQTQFGYFPDEDFFEANHNLPGRNKTDQWYLIGEVNWNVGPGTVTSITAYRDVPTFDTDLDVDETPFTLIHFPNNEESSNQFSQELRYASTVSDNFDFVAGAYYFNMKMRIIERRQLTGVAAGRAHEDFLFQQGDFTQRTESIAGFIHGNYHLNEAWTISAGGRYTHEKKELDLIPITTCAGPGFTGCATTVTPLEESWNNFSPTIGVDYQPHDDFLAYAKWTRGFRSGNYNGRTANPAAVGPADPEKVDQIEVGMKGTFLEGRLRVNAAAFWSDFKDIQRPFQRPFGGGLVQDLANAGSATILGAELEVTAIPHPDLVLEASGGWTDASFDEFLGLDVDGDGQITPEDNAAAKELKFDRVPEFNFHVAGTYTFPIKTLAGDLFYRVAYTWKDEFFTDIRNVPNLKQDSYGLLDMSLTYQTENWRVAVFGKNLTKTEYADVYSRIFNFQAFGGTPRTWGLEVSFEY